MQFGFYFGGGWAARDDEDGLGFIAVFLISLAVYAVSFFLMQALSRYREFAADRGAAIITGRPSALASALMKISVRHAPDPAAGPARDLAARRVLHLPARRKSALGELFSTHPLDGEAHRRPAAPRGASCSPAAS